MKFDGGVLTANLTSFRPDFSIDVDNMAALASEMAARPGIRGFVVNAFAGEGPTLTNAERIRVIEVHRESARVDQPVVASVLDTSTAGAIRQALEAKDAGADGIMICPPIVSSWNAVASPQIAITYHKAIAAAVDLHTRYKEAAYMLGVVSSPEVRGPQTRLSEVEREKIRSLLIDAGYL